MLRTLLTLSTVSLLSLGFALPATAADPVKPPPLVQLEKDGVMVKYLGREQGQDGWMTVKNGRIEYMYTTPDQKGLVLGVMFDENGDSVTAKQLQRAYHADADLARAIGANPLLEAPPVKGIVTAQVPPIAPPISAEEAGAKAAKGAARAEKLIATLAQANGFDLGQPTAPTAYVFIDPQCPHCKDFLRRARDGKYLESGRLHLRVLPVAVVNEKSVGQSAALLAAPNPQALIWAVADGNKDAIPVAKEPNLDKLKQNLQIMVDYKFDVTPIIVYRGKDGKVKLVRGIPNDMEAAVNDIGPLAPTVAQ